MEERYLRPSQVTEIIPVKVGTVYRWINEGLLPHYKIGGKVGNKGQAVLIKESDVRAFIERGRVR